VSSGGTAAFTQLSYALTTTLLMSALLVVGCLLLCAISAGFAALRQWRSPRRAARRRDAWVRAEAARGIAELDRYLRRWDATR
jgi:hypothetical protein